MSLYLRIEQGGKGRQRVALVILNRARRVHAKHEERVRLWYKKQEAAKFIKAPQNLNRPYPWCVHGIYRAAFYESCAACAEGRNVFNFVKEARNALYVSNRAFDAKEHRTELISELIRINAPVPKYLINWATQPVTRLLEKEEQCL